jgi:hypothetical protein
MLRVPRGTMRFTMDLQPRFNYGRETHKLTVSDRGAMFEAGDMHLTHGPEGDWSPAHWPSSTAAEQAE